MNTESIDFCLFGEDDKKGTDWKDEIQSATKAEENSLTRTLWAFRQQFRRIKNTYGDCLSRIWAAFRQEDNGSLNDNPRGSLQQEAGNTEVLTPLVDALPHLKLAVPGTLDCAIASTSWEAFSLFLIRQEESICPLLVMLDGSEDSAWERFVLHMAGQQLFLGWHANYAVRRIVTDVRRFDEEVDISNAGERAWWMIGDEGRARLLKNDFSPSVSISDDLAIVSCFTFSPFRGLIRVTNEVNLRTGTLTPCPNQDEIIVEYNCGVSY